MIHLIHTIYLSHVCAYLYLLIGSFFLDNSIAVFSLSHCPRILRYFILRRIKQLLIMPVYRFIARLSDLVVDLSSVITWWTYHHVKT